MSKNDKVFDSPLSKNNHLLAKGFNMSGKMVGFSGAGTKRGAILTRVLESLL